MLIGIMGCSTDNPTAPSKQNPSPDYGNKNTKSDTNNVAQFDESEHIREIMIQTPSDLRAEIVDDILDVSKPGCTVDLTWQDNSNNEAGFLIKRKTGIDGLWRVIGQVGAGVVAFHNCDLIPNRTYYYMVQAYNGDTRSGYSNEVSVFTRNMTQKPAV